MTDIRRPIFRASSVSASGGTLHGTAAVFDSRTEIWDGHWEEIAPTAFDAVAEDDVRAVVDHRLDADALLGRRAAGTLRTEIDRVGVHVEIDLPDTRTAVDLAALVERGDIDGMSFGVFPGEWATAPVDGGELTRHTAFSRWVDVSVVVIPAYGDTNVILRAEDLGHATQSRMALRAARARRLRHRALVSRRAHRRMAT